MSNLDQRPDSVTALRLNTPYKQATQGGASGEPPGAMDMIRRATYYAWANVKGMSEDDAMQKYINLADSLDG